MQTAFTPAPAERLIPDTGNVLKPLRNLQQQYVERAQYLAALEVRPEKDGMYYENAAARVGVLACAG